MDKKGILEPAALFSEPGEAYSLDFRKWQGCPTIARTAGGRLWAGWYSGGICEPDENNYNLLVYSDDEGSTWSDPVLVIDSRPEIRLRAMDIQLWMDPAEKLWVFWTQTEDSEQKDENGRCLEYTDGIFGVWAVTTQEPESSRPVWTPPVRISDGFLRCRPTVLSDQRILMCPYDWTHDRYAYNISCDHGASWERFFGTVKLYETNCFDEAMAVERRDGILWMLVRTAHGALAQTFSCDKGQSWLPAGLSGIENPSSRFWIGRLQSGRLLLINHCDFVGRNRLTALLSEDEGETWPWRLLLDERENVSYPDAAECADGSIFCIYDRERTDIGEILLARFTEEDIFAGTMVSDGSYRKRCVSCCRSRIRSVGEEEESDES